MVKLQKVEMTEGDLREKKLHLASCKITKDETDSNLLEMEAQLDAKIATRLLDDDINKLKEDIDRKTTYNSLGKEIPTTEADLDMMNIALDKLKNQKELDLPARKLRFNISKLKDAKMRPDAPELQIKKLEREIREKAYEIVAKEETTMVD